MGGLISFLLNTRLRPIMKFMLRQYSGRSEIARICAGEDPKYEAQHNASMSMKLARSLKLSKHLEDLTNPIFVLVSFSIIPIKTAIIQRKKLHQDKSRLVVANMVHCLQSLRLVNVIYEHMLAKKNTVFQYSSLEHVELLESLWTYLKPGVVRTHNRQSKEWGELGFQGLDPATDFRGMGLLGLEQLVYFSRHYPKQAIHLLNMSNDPQIAYFPFAATSINITALVLQFYQDGRLHQYLFERENMLLLQDNGDSAEGVSDDMACVTKGVAFIHDFYSELYTEFGRLWLAKKPRDLMDFPPIFAEFKNSLIMKYPSFMEYR